VILGIDAGRNITGQYNTILGYGAGSSWGGQSSSSDNTFVGDGAGSGGHLGRLGSSNVCLGKDAGYGKTGDHKLYIANNSTTSLIYGEFDNQLVVIDGSLGVNHTSTPVGGLDLRGDELRVWDGSAAVTYAYNEGDLYVEHTLEVDDEIIVADHIGAYGGVHVGSGTDPGDDNLWVDGVVGVNSTSPLTRFHVRHAVNSTATPANHVALIDNYSTGTSPDVLALRVGYTGNPGTAINYITFFKGASTGIGAIEGNGSGGISFNSSSADYAEFLPVMDRKVEFEDGDIVGIHGGRISMRTEGADVVLAISSTPIVVGNNPGEEKLHLHEKVGFMGIVPVKVQGKVKAGDYIIASGNNDGVGLAVPKEEIRPEQFSQLVGVAWDSSRDHKVKMIRTAIGVSSWTTLLEHQQSELKRIDKLENELNELKDIVREMSSI
jgi:hypothetical protein